MARRSGARSAGGPTQQNSSDFLKNMECPTPRCPSVPHHRAAPAPGAHPSHPPRPKRAGRRLWDLIDGTISSQRASHRIDTTATAATPRCTRPLVRHAGGSRTRLRRRGAVLGRGSAPFAAERGGLRWRVGSRVGGLRDSPPFTPRPAATGAPLGRRRLQHGVARRTRAPAAAPAGCARWRRRARESEGEKDWYTQRLSPAASPPPNQHRRAGGGGAAAATGGLVAAAAAFRATAGQRDRREPAPFQHPAWR